MIQQPLDYKSNALADCATLGQIIEWSELDLHQRSPRQMIYSHLGLSTSLPDPNTLGGIWTRNLYLERVAS